MAQRLIKDNPGDVTEKWQGDIERRLKRAQEWFGKERSLISIEPKHVREWINKLTAVGFANGTIRHHLHALSSVYRYAPELDTVPPSCNPVSRLYRKPSARPRDRKESQRAEYLEIPDAAKALEAARKLKHTRRNGLIKFVHPLVATFLLTGGRKAEVLGLTWGDIDFDLGLVTFAPNQAWPQARVVRAECAIWPQLREILEAYRRAGCSPSDLLFPSPRTAHGGREGMVNDLRKAMAELRKQSSVNLPEGVTIFRHTYATARFQTTDNGKQIGTCQRQWDTLRD